MSEIKVEKGVPLPGRKGGDNVYPFRDMEIGDSFFVPDRTSAWMGGRISYAKHKYGGSYTCRTVTENGIKGVRVWRVK